MDKIKYEPLVRPSLNSFERIRYIRKGIKMFLKKQKEINKTYA